MNKPSEAAVEQRWCDSHVMSELFINGFMILGWWVQLNVVEYWHIMPTFVCQLFIFNHAWLCVCGIGNNVGTQIQCVYMFALLGQTLLSMVNILKLEVRDQIFFMSGVSSVGTNVKSIQCPHKLSKSTCLQCCRTQMSSSLLSTWHDISHFP